MEVKRLEIKADDPNLLGTLRELVEAPAERIVLQVGKVDQSAVNLYVDTLKDWFREPNKVSRVISLEHIEGLDQPTWIIER